MEKEKRYIPNTNPDWGLELPNGYDNSLVDKFGKNHDNGYNFDESAYESEDLPKFDPEAAQKAREESLRKLKEKS